MTDLKTQINRFLEHLEIERNCSQLTIRNYHHYLLSFYQFLHESGDGNKKVSEEEQSVREPAIGDINPETVRSFRVKLARKPGLRGEMKMVTQSYYIIALRSFLKWLVKNDIKALSPEKLDVPKSRDHSLKFLDAGQVERLVNQPLTSSKTGLRDRAILEVLFSTGLRVSELVALDRNKVDIVRREFGVLGKGGRSRLVFLSKRAAYHLERYLKSRLDHYTPLFIRLGGRMSLDMGDEQRRLTPRSIQRLVKRYAALAQLPVEATPHTLRHSLATDLLRAGADLRSIQEILGHKNIATTQVYTHITDARLREVHDKFHSGNKS